jgi:outer membrane protein TolC
MRRVLDAEAARAAVEVADRSLEWAKENQRVASDRYRAGVIVSSELLDAEVVLLRAGLERAESLTQLRVAGAALDRATGR